MATQLIRRNFNWLWYFSIGANLSLLGLLWACGQPAEKAGRSGITKIGVDQTYVSAIEAVEQVFEKRFAREVEVYGVTEKKALSAFLHDSVQLIVLTRKPDSALREVLSDQGYTLYADPIAFSAKVIIAAQSRPFRLEENKKMALLNQDLSTQRWVMEQGVKKVESFDRPIALFEQLQIDTQLTGVIDLYQLNQLKKQNGWPFAATLSVLPVEVGDSSVYPQQDAIANGRYPFYTPIYFYLKQVKVDEEEGFLSFVFNRDGQRILEKEGLIPKLEYPRTLNVRK